jgi:hypothetical protein
MSSSVPDPALASLLLAETAAAAAGAGADDVPAADADASVPAADADAFDANRSCMADVVVVPVSASHPATKKSIVGVLELVG